ncbi:conserved hypothetical protein [Lebetimonas natsushimae]|uniref:Uncharacterized protein n=1 Tax=Lebetimonas natsushimae TaxID=1936991 RepID=A0A292YB61_9BACT|nr:hypothetical protein [Lebetimonas natsushimae]GAX87008.1 conserved hypothetical protein [Lebetimonas natsushimae]
MSLNTIRKRAMQNKRLQEYLKENNLSLAEVSIKELTSKGWVTLQKDASKKDVSEAMILISSGKIQLVLPL